MAQNSHEKKIGSFPRVFILILNFNGWRNTLECLESVLRLDYPDYRIVVIDNGSDDGSLGKIKDWAAGKILVDSKFFSGNLLDKPVYWKEYDRKIAEMGGLPELEAEIEMLPSNRRMIIIQTGANLGYAGGNNVGIKYALACSADYVWLLNNDTIVDKESLSAMIKLAESNTKIGLVGPKILFYDKPQIIQSVGGWVGINPFHQLRRAFPALDDGSWNYYIEPHLIYGTALLAKCDVFEEIGLLDERYFMYYEDNEFNYRAKTKGWKSAYCWEAKIWHKEAGSASCWKDPLRDYYLTRNGLYFYWNVFPKVAFILAFVPILVLKIFIKCRKKRGHVIPWIIKGYWDFLLGRYGPIRECTWLESLRKNILKL